MANTLQLNYLDGCFAHEFQLFTAVRESKLVGVEAVPGLCFARRKNIHKVLYKCIPLLVEVNVGGESSKSGYSPESLMAELKELTSLPHLRVEGLMTVPPWKPVPEQVRPYFVKARELKEECERRLGDSLPHLSMGMSGDFEVAIEEGATIIRVGTALFGERHTTLRPV